MSDGIHKPSYIVGRLRLEPQAPSAHAAGALPRSGAGVVVERNNSFHDRQSTLPEC